MAIDRLTPGDELMLRASVAWPQHIVALAILDGAGLFDEAGSFRIDAVRAAVGSRLGRAFAGGVRADLAGLGAAGSIGVEEASMSLDGPRGLTFEGGRV